jgi:hypothetical protein
MAKKATSKFTRAQGDAQPPDTGKPSTLAQLVRVIAALPLHRFISLNDALSKAKSRLGSGDLAARDLWQHAKARRLTIAARRIRYDGTEEVLILRSRFWQYFVITRTVRFQDPVSMTGAYDAAWVRGPSALPGRWYLFVDHRQLDKLYYSRSPQQKKPTAASQDEADDETKISPVAWLREKAWRMKKAEEIPAGVCKTDLMKMFHGRMKVANSRLNSKVPLVSLGYIMNEANGWGLWPVSEIKEPTIKVKSKGAYFDA